MFSGGSSQHVGWVGGWVGGGVFVMEEQAGDRSAEPVPRTLANLNFAILKKQKWKNKMQKQTF